MATCRLSARGPASPVLVWQRYAEPARWPSWSPQIRRVSVGPETVSAKQRIVAGLTGQVHGPAGIKLDFVVDRVDETARTWDWTVRLGPISLRLLHTVEAVASGATLTRLSVTGPLPVVLGYLPLAQLALGRLVRS